MAARRGRVPTPGPFQLAAAHDGQEEGPTGWYEADWPRQLAQPIREIHRGNVKECCHALCVCGSRPT